MLVFELMDGVSFDIFFLKLLFLLLLLQLGYLGLQGLLVLDLILKRLVPMFQCLHLLLLHLKPAKK